jgi:hypothetical protein
LTEIMQQRGLENIARWLPFRTTEKDLRHWLLNKALRPHLIPGSREDILLEHAVTREALAMVLEALRDECETFAYDLVVAGGGVLAHAPHPGLAALTILDALQPTTENNRVLDVRLDVLSLLPACGALAALDADSAMTMFDRDVLRNEPLATCIVALGDGKPGQVAVEAELITRRGRTRRVSVAHGQIARLPLSQGMSGRLVLRPASGVRIGTNAPGEEVPSDAPIEGSNLGVIIDARGRPLKLARGDVERRKQLWEWMVALGAERGRSPYLDASVVISTPTSEETVKAPANGRDRPTPMPQFQMPPVAEQAPPMRAAPEPQAEKENLPDVSPAAQEQPEKPEP